MRLLKPGWVAQDDHPIFSIDIHPAGGKFATGGQTGDCGRVTVWNMAPILDPKVQKDPNVPKMLCQMDNHLACVNCVRWSNSGKYLASAGDDQRIILWTKSAYGCRSGINHESYKMVYTLQLHHGDILDVSWSPGDVWLATASVDNSVIIWDVEKLPSTVAILKGHTGHVKGVTWDPLGKYLASQSADKTLRVWRTSDWVEEVSVSEPFQECGGTTHALRLDWSPDGQYLVSAHAMNGGGPTAQILERDGWKFENDFVGHRKAVTCVRFNDNIFEKDSEGKKSPFVCLAIGSRDRSMSVWVTSLKRPLFVIKDVFESSILDLAWSKDGLVLLACSMDGSVAAVVLNEKELGAPMNKHNRRSMLQKLGLVQNSKPIKIKLSKLTPSFPKRGPTDKQLEMITSDGRRRITPISIPPGTKLMQSSGAKSKIVIEKLDGIVEPNVSLGKKSGSPVSDNSQLSSSPAPKTNRIAIKDKPGPTNTTNPAINSSRAKENGTTDHKASSDSQARGPPFNMIKEKKASGKPPGVSGWQVKKKIKRINSEYDSSSDLNNKRKISDGDTPGPAEKAGRKEEKDRQESKEDISKKLKMKEAQLDSTRRNLDEVKGCLRECQGELIARKKDYEKKTKHHDELRKEKDELKEMMKMKEEEIDLLQKQLDQARKVVDKVETIKKSLEERRRVHGNLINQLNRQEQEFNNMMEEERNHEKLRIKEEKESERKMKMTEEENKFLREELRQYKENLEQSQDGRRREKEEFEEILRMKDSEIEALGERLKKQCVREENKKDEEEMINQNCCKKDEGKSL